jgi:hypothetical protein
MSYPPPCPGLVTKVPIPKSGYYWQSAEAYFYEQLRIYYKSLGYLCFSQFEYAGLTTRKDTPRNPYDTYPKEGISHSHSDLARILEMLNERFRSPPDFLAIRGNHGVVAEIGTDSYLKRKQLERYLNHLNILSFAYAATNPLGRTNWRGASYRPLHGPTIFPCGKLLICTAPTWPERAIPPMRPLPDGVLLYEAHTKTDHRVTFETAKLPALSREARNSLTSVLRSAPGVEGTENAWARHALSAVPELSMIIKRFVLPLGALAVLVLAAYLAVLTPGIPDEILLANLAAALLRGASS